MVRRKLSVDFTEHKRSTLHPIVVVKLAARQVKDGLQGKAEAVRAKRRLTSV